LIKSIENLNTDKIFKLICSKDGKYIYSIGEENEIKIYTMDLKFENFEMFEKNIFIIIKEFVNFSFIKNNNDENNTSPKTLNGSPIERLIKKTKSLSFLKKEKLDINFFEYNNNEKNNYLFKKLFDLIKKKYNIENNKNETNNSIKPYLDKDSIQNFLNIIENERFKILLKNDTDLIKKFEYFFSLLNTIIEKNIGLLQIYNYQCIGFDNFKSYFNKEFQTLENLKNYNLKILFLGGGIQG
jgi:hypothetical protein